MITFDKVRSLAALLPGVEEATSYGTPAFKVRNKLMARLKEDNETLVVRVTQVVLAGHVDHALDVQLALDCVARSEHLLASLNH